MSGARPDRAAGGARRPGRHAFRPSDPALRPVRRGWSRFVAMMKVVFPTTALVLVAVVVAWSQFSGFDKGFKVGFSKIRPDDAKTLRMVNARYAGVNKNQQPYLLTADQAIQDKPDADLVRLVNPKGDITSRSGTWTAVSAPGGYYHQASQLLDLYGGVQMFFDTGLEFTSPTAHIDLKRNVASGDDHVLGYGPDRQITADGFRLLDGGKRIIFTGHAKLTLYPQGSKGRGDTGGTGK